MRFYPKKIASVLAGWAMSIAFPKPIQKVLIKTFADHYDIDLDEAEKPLEEYRSLQEFFTRRLKPGLRPQEQLTPGAINCPVDGKLLAIGRIEHGTLFQAKGMLYSLGDLLKHTPDVEQFEGGHFLTIYLSPKNYHRIHVPLKGTVQAVCRVEGELWPVNDSSVKHTPKLYERNRRATWLAKGTGQDSGISVACVLVGATHVGGCIIDEQWLFGSKLPKDGGLLVNNLPCTPGQDLGMFQFGSTVVLLIGGTMADKWNPLRTEGYVEVGQRLGEYQ